MQPQLLPTSQPATTRMAALAWGWFIDGAVFIGGAQVHGGDGLQNHGGRKTGDDSKAVGTVFLYCGSAIVKARMKLGPPRPGYAIHLPGPAVFDIIANADTMGPAKALNRGSGARRITGR